MTNKRIYLSPPHMSGLEKDYIQEAFASNWIAPLGPHVDTFEQEIAAYAGVGGAVALNSGTAAIHLALKYLGVARGDRVYCSSLTFAASVNPVLYEGGEPVFIDSEPESWNMSPLALEKAFHYANKEKWLPKAVIVVDLYGQSADMQPILELCGKYKVPVVEDAAEALGADCRGGKCGTFGEFGIYSFNGNKIITTSGGGALLSDNEEALKKVRFWATQARDPARHYQHSEVGYNYRLSNVLAGIGRAQLKVLEQRIEARRKIFEKYYEALSSIEGLNFLPEASFGRSNRWLTVMTVNSKILKTSPNQLMDALAQGNIESRPVWKPMHLQPLFKDCLYFSHADQSISDDLFYQGICLPSGSSLSEIEQDMVIECIKKTL